MNKKILVSLFFVFIFSARTFAANEYHVPYPPLTPGIFPCMECHEGLDRNKKRRVLKEMHQNIKIEHHGDRWCYDCHDERNMNKLKLASGDSINFNESYKLCGQCHGNVYNDWKRGIHGKRMGNWDGEKQYLLCVHCHNPHSPKFKEVKPDPAPEKPTRHGSKAH